MAEESGSRQQTPERAPAWLGYVPIVGLVVTLMVLLFDRGLVWRFAGPVVNRTVEPQLMASSVVLNACSVRNSGTAPASDVRVRLWTEENVPFDELVVVGAEGEWETISGGIGQTHVLIWLDRLMQTHSLTATISTQFPVDLQCAVAHRDGLAKPIGKAFITLSTGDFIVLFILGCLPLAVGALAYWRLGMRRNRTRANST